MDAQWQCRIQGQAQRDAFGFGFLCVALLQLIQQGLEDKVHSVQMQLTRLQLRKVQDVIDHLKQVFGGSAYVANHRQWLWLI